MKFRTRPFFIWFVVLLLVWPGAVRGEAAINDLRPTLILISIDGFRADYLSRYTHPTLDALSRAGVRARWMQPSFPSLTFPNHYAVVTGLYPEHSGIVANEFYDPVFGARFATSKREENENGRWWGGEPIWITAEKQGQKASATFWPGSQAEIEGARPSYWKPFDDKVPADDRVDALLSLLDLPLEQRPTFLTLYLSNVDHAGHDYSPKSDAVANAITVVDSALERLISGLRARSIFEKVNIIVISDHGMASVPLNHTVILDDYFDARRAQEIVWGWELVNIFPKPGEEAALFRSLKGDRLLHAHCYRKRDIPARFHYDASRRIGGIVCMAEEGWEMESRACYEEAKKESDRPTNTRGAHGYDNQASSMRAIFIARGPAFKRGTTINAFPNVNVYNIMARVLNLKPANNDGSMRTARAVLRNR